MSIKSKEYAEAYAQTESGKAARKRARDKYNKKNREKNNERGRKKWKRVAACLNACEGFDAPMELRRRYDQAVEILRPIQWGMSAESLHATRAFIEAIDKAK